MTTAFNIRGNEGNLAKVTKDGEIFTRLQFSTVKKITLVSDDTAITIVKPRAGEKIIITGLIVNTNRDIGVNGAVIQIYESAGETSSTSSRDIISFDLVKNQTVVTAPIIVETTAGVFINAISDDSNVNVTLLYYFVKV